MVSASGSEASVTSSMPTSAIIYDAYTSIIKIIYFPNQFSEAKNADMWLPSVFNYEGKTTFLNASQNGRKRTKRTLCILTLRIMVF